jgi:pimeloyl-ACP methyl ester carboxylesterase
MWQSLQPEMTRRPPVSAEVMIIESDNDPLIGRRERAALRKLYPQARLLRFRRTGHLSAIVETERYVAAVEEFLDAPLLPPKSS